MAEVKFTKAQEIRLKGHTTFTEAWVKKQIQEDPSILGLGNVEVRDIERSQPGKGRLDLLLVDDENDRWYEVEVQLGATDESHIIRTIEYWDKERNRYRNYDHCAVLVAEDITSRFLNVIALFNNQIPIIAIQMKALQVAGHVTLHCARVVDKLEPPDMEEPPGTASPVDRNDWAQRYSLAAVDACVRVLQEIDPNISESYKQQFIGLTVSGRANNFITFHPRKQFTRVKAWPKSREAWLERLENSGLVTLPGGHRSVRFRLTPAEIDQHRSLLKELFQDAYDHHKD